MARWLTDTFEGPSPPREIVRDRFPDGRELKTGDGLRVDLLGLAEGARTDDEISDVGGDRIRPVPVWARESVAAARGVGSVGGGIGGGGGGAGGGVGPAGVPAGGGGLPGVGAAGRKAVNFHLTGNIAGGAAASEVRVWGPISTAFKVVEVGLYSVGAIQVGQFVDLLVSTDGSVADDAVPSGQSVFSSIEDDGSVPSVDTARGLAVPDGSITVPVGVTVWTPGQWLKARSLFVAPAVALPDVHLVVVVEPL